MENILDDQKELRNFIIDCYGFILFALDNDFLDRIGETMTHDIIGIVKNEQCFVPRVSGYRRCIKSSEKLMLGVKL